MTKDPTGKDAEPNLRHLAGESNAAIAAFEAYWHKMRKGKLVPRRSDIDPRGIEPLLSNAFIVERIAPGLARLRIAGGHLTDLMGMEVRGMPISAFIEPGARDTLAHHLVRLFDQPATLRLSLSAPARPSAPALTGTLVMLPLRSDLGDISRALGCLVSTGNIGRGPRRFEIVDAVVNPLDGAAIPDASPRLIMDDLGEEVVRMPENGPMTASERPYLRLIKS
ncbi:PAS domain-containing protein [Roseovarius sp. Pro17]|uniref:PAS domain-containing protein n=1 Tax=Roseovarius sp. Pro17 TaxID=3108175 RepID=UPI002D77E21D|nr:PAS domain-containing protein [Roseovarius sp. Pro17]